MLEIVVPIIKPYFTGQILLELTIVSVITMESIKICKSECSLFTPSGENNRLAAQISMKIRNRE
jgi:hypothetical protein